MAWKIWNVFVFAAEKEKGSTWLFTVRSIHYPGASFCSYVINRQRNMIVIGRKNSIGIIRHDVRYQLITIYQFLSKIGHLPIF